MLSETYLLFVISSTLLIIVPGPNVALIVANSLAHGVRGGLATVLGTSSAMLLQLSCVVLGLSSLMVVLADWFEMLRWVGVVYLVYLAATSWRTPEPDLTLGPAQTAPLSRVILTGFAVSLTNPKTLLFMAAFLPQFVPPTGDAGTSLLILAATFLAIATICDSAWAIVSPRARSVLKVKGRTLNRLTGGLLFTTAVGLALSRKP